MNKKLLLGVFLFGAALSGKAQTVLFQDSFETYENFIITDIGQWTQIDIDDAPTYTIDLSESVTVDFPNSEYIGTAIVFNPSGTDPVLTEEAYGAHSGDKLLYFIAAVLDNPANPDLVGPNNDWMITPQITLGASGNTFSFWAKSLTDDFGLEKLKVAVSTTGNTNPGDFTVISGDEPVGVPTAWTQYTYSLDAYAGQPVYIAINYISEDTYVLKVDDVLVTTSATAGVNDVLASQFNVFPNPANDIVSVAGNVNILISTIEIVDLNGRVIKSTTFNNVSEAQINVSDLSAGMYLACISSDKGTTIKKIVKN
jgi:hypothetical protein